MPHVSRAKAKIEFAFDFCSIYLYRQLFLLTMFLFHVDLLLYAHNLRSLNETRIMTNQKSVIN